MHNGFLTIDNEKMSKSLGNFFTIRDVLKRVRDPEVVRYFVLSSHYRGPVNYSAEQLTQADAALTRLYTALRDAPEASAEPSEFTRRFCESMDDDFNTPEAVAVLQSLARAINQAKDRNERTEAGRLAAELRALGGVLGLMRLEPGEYLKKPVGSIATEGASADAAVGTGRADFVAFAAHVEALIAQRIAARQRKDFKEADRIRDALAAEGVVLEDRAGGKTEWRRS
jgi:cysteinyl-tRNA synthetase